MIPKSVRTRLRVRFVEWLQFTGVVAQLVAVVRYAAVNDSGEVSAWIAAGGLTMLLVGMYADRFYTRWSERILMAGIYAVFMGVPIGFLAGAWFGWLTASVGVCIALFALVFVFSPDR